MKKQHVVLSLAIASALLAPLAHADISHVLDSAAVYGNVTGSTLHYGTTSGGIGVNGSYVEDHVLFTVNYLHNFGSFYDTPGIIGGSANTLNLKLGYLFPISSHFEVGPYIGYQYQAQNAQDGQYVSIQDYNNAIGAGGFAAYGMGPLTLTGYIGYLPGISASADAQAYGHDLSEGVPSSNDLQLDAQVSYQFTPHLYAFTAFRWDHYTAKYNYSNGLLQGDVGLGYSF